jgi:hypothetical protein
MIRELSFHEIKAVNGGFLFCLGRLILQILRPTVLGNSECPKGGCKKPKEKT